MTKALVNNYTTPLHRKDEIYINRDMRPTPKRDQHDFTFDRNFNKKSESKNFNIPRKRNRYQSSEGISSGEDQNDTHYPAKKFQKDSSGNPHETSTGMSSTYLCLNGGEIMIQGNGIETTAPCEIEKITMNK